MDGATHRLFCDTGERIMRHYSKYSHVGLEVVSEPYSEVTRDICLPRYRDTSILRRPTACNEIMIATVMNITGGFSRAQTLAT